MGKKFQIVAIGRVHCTRQEPTDDHWDQEETTIVLDRDVLGATAARGIDSFSHIEVLYVFDRVPDHKIVTDARRPRDNPNWPEIGILAQRGKNRPNKIGATICRVISASDLTIVVHGLDAIDGTPIIDVKPVMAGFLPRGDVSEPDWSRELMAEYW